MKKILLALAAAALSLGTAACYEPKAVQEVRVTFAFFAYDEGAKDIANMSLAVQVQTPDEQWSETFYAPSSIVISSAQHPSIAKGAVVTANGVGNATTTLECLWNAQAIYSYSPHYDRSLVSANPEDKRFGPDPSVQCIFDPIRSGFLKEES